MPVKRDADGNIIEEKTKIGETFQQITPTIPGQSSAGDTVGPGKDPNVDPGNKLGYDARTVLAGSTRGAEREQDKDPKTRIYRPGRTERGDPTTAAGAGTQDEQASAMDDPPVGWLVVIKGPGQGRFVALGNGSNSIGRDESERVRIDFGDETISRRGHSTHYLRSPRQEVLPAARRRKKTSPTWKATPCWHRPNLRASPGSR